ncbi:hypothetical protein CFI10_11480 [Marinobacterium iners]|nr:hypothetical protein CFI10_11480 [Marinobacterium iners]
MIYVLIIGALLTILYFADRKVSRYIKEQKELKEFSDEEKTKNKELAIKAYYAFAIPFIILVVAFIIKTF